MKVTDALLDDEEDDVHISDEDQEERMSLASDLDSDDLEEIEKKEREIKGKMPKKKKYGSLNILSYIVLFFIVHVIFKMITIYINI